MWKIASRPSPWLRVSSLKPAHVLDEYDVPRLFTVTAEDGHLLLAYHCADERATVRYLLVPADDELITKIANNEIALRDALTSRSWAWIVDLAGREISTPMAINVRDLPPSALPKAGVRLSRADDVLLRVRMMGKNLAANRVPASVVKKLVDGVTGAVRTLSAQALSVEPSAGRPADLWRRYYDLPAVEFGFQSFEMAFGRPEIPPDLQFDEVSALDKIQSLLTKGLTWATEAGEADVVDTPEWSAIADALAKLAPPHTGIVEEVQVSGELAGRRRRPVRLTRATSDRIAAARKRLTPDKRSRTHEGFVREFDKDKLTFILRDARHRTICEVSCAQEQYDDVYLAFDADKLVNIVVYEMATPPVELVSITFSAPREEEGSPE